MTVSVEEWDTLNIRFRILPVTRNFPVGRQESGSMQQFFLSVDTGFGNPDTEKFYPNLCQEYSDVKEEN